MTSLFGVLGFGGLTISSGSVLLLNYFFCWIGIGLCVECNWFLSLGMNFKMRMMMKRNKIGIKNE